MLTYLVGAILIVVIAFAVLRLIGVWDNLLAPGPHRPVDFARIAEQIGALGIRVERASAVGPALEQALAAERPSVVDVATDMEALAPLAWSASA